MDRDLSALFDALNLDQKATLLGFLNLTPLPPDDPPHPSTAASSTTQDPS